MSFKVEVEISEHDGEYCGYCEFLHYRIDGRRYCPVFKKEIDNETGIERRCPECLQAEKEYPAKDLNRSLALRLLEHFTDAYAKVVKEEIEDAEDEEDDFFNLD